MDIDDVLDDVFKGKMSMKKASERYNYGRDFLKRELTKKYANNPANIGRLQDLMKEQTISSAQKYEMLKRDVVCRFLNREISFKEVTEQIKISDKEELKEIIKEMVADNKNDLELQDAYKTYKKYLKEKGAKK